MVRSLAVAVGVVCALSTISWANPPVADDDTGFRNVLAVQQAMEHARYLLLVPNARKAVEVLEEHLPRINGNATYLRLLREAYRGYIKDLWSGKQAFLAKRYLERLCIIDPHASQDPILCGNLATDDKAGLAKVADKSITASPVMVVTPAVQTPTVASSEPKTTQHVLNPAASTSQPVVIARAKVEDPFDLTNQRLRGQGSSLARQLQAMGDTEFARQHYGQARGYYERAYQADAQTIETSRHNWAYCVLCHVVDQLNQSTSSDSLDDLRKLVQSAVAMAPTLGEPSQKLLKEIDARGSRAGATGATGSVTALKHLGKNGQGWQVAETSHFRIFHKQTPEFVEKVAQVVERTRLDMYRKWFGHDGSDWPARCDLFLHATVADYSRMTGESTESPGHSRMEIDPASQRVVARRMDMHCDLQGMLDTVLPHETTHTVLAGMFGPTPVPRWADEGVAVLSEISARIEQHRRNLVRCHKEGSLFSVRELMEMSDYPARQRISAFYAQSVFLVEFLTTQRGPVVFTEFLRDGLGEGYELALRRHYGWSFSDLEARWGQYVVAGQ